MVKIKEPKAIVGPLIADFTSIGGGDVTLATAFYTGGALNALSLKANRLCLFMRLNTSSVADWASGALDPVALRSFIQRHQQTCAEVSLFINPTAHAKIYSGQNGYLVGSANLSTRALSGNAAEILWFENDSARRQAMNAAVKEYAQKFAKFSLSQLDDYIAKNADKAKELAKKIPPELHTDEDRLPTGIVRPSRLGDYDAFLKWLSKQSSAAAKELHARALGKSNLGGHIRQAFFGVRQFFIVNPAAMQKFIKIPPDNYSFSGDALTTSVLGNFVTKHARDEGPFSPAKWQSYLPKRAGGNQASGGATVGNLNRMFPLLARYLHSKIGTKT
jgi:hypothetical protein